MDIAVNKSTLNLWIRSVCFNHIEQIKAALSIAGVGSSQSAWSPRNDDGKDGMQIDMLIDRADNVVNLCEIKYYSDVVCPDKDMYLTMTNRKNVVEHMVSRKKTVRNTLITTFGIRKNEYSSVFTNVITIDDLFRDV